jgi:hypothetical protein
MPIGQNRHVPEFGKFVPDSCPPERPERPAGLGAAIIMSLGLHALAGLLIWHELISERNQDPGAPQIIDTRVKDPGLEVEVCLRLIDSPKPGSKDRSPERLSASVQSSPSRPTATDSLETSKVAGAESSKPRQRNQDHPSFAGASKTQPRPPETGFPVPTSEGQFLSGGTPGGSGNGTGTGDGATSFFQIGARAKSVVYVIDRSVSMGPSGGLVRAKQELIGSLRGMPDQTLFQIIVFNRSVEMLLLGSATGLLPATNENKRKAIELLAPIQPEGGTQPVPALKRALALKPEVIFFLSDGADWTDRQVQEVISINRGHTIIHVVDFGETDRIKGPLQMLARRSQGEYRSVPERGREPWQIQGN